MRYTAANTKAADCNGLTIEPVRGKTVKNKEQNGCEIFTKKPSLHNVNEWAHIL